MSAQLQDDAPVTLGAQIAFIAEECERRRWTSAGMILAAVLATLTEAELGAADEP